MFQRFADVEQQHNEHILRLKPELTSLESALEQREPSVKLPVEVLVTILLVEYICNSLSLHSYSFGQLNLNFVAIGIIGPKVSAQNSESPPEFGKGQQFINPFTYFLAVFDVFYHIEVGCDCHRAYFFLNLSTFTAIFFNKIVSMSTLGSFKESISLFPIIS